MKIPRAFTVRYNPFTECVEILDNAERIMQVITDVKSHLDVLSTAMKKMDHL